MINIKINNIKEPEHSNEKLKEFEKKYGFTSEYFYEHYQQGEILIKDEYKTLEWVFEYEINKKTKGGD